MQLFWRENSVCLQRKSSSFLIYSGQRVKFELSPFPTQPALAYCFGPVRAIEARVVGSMKNQLESHKVFRLSKLHRESHHLPPGLARFEYIWLESGFALSWTWKTQPVSQFSMVHSRSSTVVFRSVLLVAGKLWKWHWVYVLLLSNSA